MAKRKRQEEGGGNEWMNTYADMVTLLFAFFVMLFSMSSVETEKWEMLVKAFSRKGEETAQVVLVPGENGEELGANDSQMPFTADEETIAPEDPSKLPDNLDELYKYMKKYIEENNLEESVNISKTIGSVSISFQNNIFFMPDSSILTSPAVEILGFMGKGLDNIGDQLLAVKVSGHTARIKEIEDYPISDWTLSTDRANSVVMFMIDNNSNISSDKYVSQGFGYNHPVDTNDTEEGREKNRRVDILILGNDVDFDNPDEMEAIIDSVYDTQLQLSEDDVTTNDEG